MHDRDLSSFDFFFLSSFSSLPSLSPRYFPHTPAACCGGLRERTASDPEASPADAEGVGQHSRPRSTAQYTLSVIFRDTRCACAKSYLICLFIVWHVYA